MELAVPITAVVIVKSMATIVIISTVVVYMDVWLAGKVLPVIKVMIQFNGNWLVLLMKIKKFAKSLELKQSEARASPQNQNGKYLILQIVKIQREHMVKRVRSYFQKGGHSATETELKKYEHT